MNYVVVIAMVLIGLMVAMQVVVRLKVRALRGKPLPDLSGAWSKRLGGSAASLVYFFSPGCAACKALTPRFEEMHRRNPKSVFVVNVADELPLARSLNVMATPSIIEIDKGVIVGYHVGRPPAQLMERWA